MREAMQYKDYYKTLGVTKNASGEEIKKAYRTLVKKYHPDKTQGDKKAEDKFKEVTEAYEVLGDAQKRKKYDEFGSQTHFSGGYDFDPSQYGFSSDNVKYEYRSGDGGYSDFFNMFFSGDNFDLGDIFSSFGSSGRGGTHSSRSRTPRTYDGQDIESEIEITPEEGHHGVSKKIALQTQTGARNITFNIPKGVNEGERIRLKDQGGEGVSGGKRGSLYMKVKFVPGRHFVKKGDDLYTTVNVFPWDAALGAKLNVKTPDGQIKVNIPKETQSGKKIRVAGRGYAARNKNPGDLYIEIKIVNPVRMTSKMKELYQQMKDLSNH